MNEYGLFQNSSEVENKLIKVADQTVQEYFDKNFETMKRIAMQKGLNEQETLQALKRAYQRGILEIENIAKQEAAKLTAEAAKTSSLNSNQG